ncbi:hypothetical protein FGB62_253g07 [Gracilaria domingensis]|nr:hypothetical protein FGB62_253g07 [Gracilaria domingensis]
MQKALQITLSTLNDEKEPPLGQTGTTASGRQHSGSKANQSAQQEFPSSPQHSSKGQVEDLMRTDSIPEKDSGTRQGQTVVKDDVEDTQKAKKIEDGLSEAKLAEKTEEAGAVGNAESSSNEEPNNSGKESVADVDNPLVLDPKLHDMNAGNTKTGDLQDGVEKRENDGGMPASAGDEPSNSKLNAVPAVEKTEPMEEAPASEQAASLIEIGSANQETESIAKEIPIAVRKAENENTANNKKSRKNVRKALQSRFLRTRSTSRGRAPDSSFDSSGMQDSTPQEVGKAPIQKSSDTASQASKGKEGGVPESDGLRPVMEAKELTMRVANAVFVTEYQLGEPKIARLKEKELLPFARLTFKDKNLQSRSATGLLFRLWSGAEKEDGDGS